MRHFHAGLVVGFVLVSCVTPVAAATDDRPAWRDKIDPALDAAPAQEAVEFLVILDARPDLGPARTIEDRAARGGWVVGKLQATARSSQQSVIERLTARGLPVRSFWIVNAVWSRGPRDAIESMARRSDVLRVDANPKLAQPVPENTAATRGPGAIEWNVSQVGADQVWSLGYDGTGIVIGSQDTGFFWDHPALISSYRGWDGSTAVHDYNWHDTVTSDTLASPTCLSNSPEPCDDGFVFPHGTYTMGVSVGDDGGTRRTGVSPGAKWIGCRNSDLGGGTPASYMECFEWLVAPTDLSGANPDPSMAPHVINNSWACIPAEGCNPDTIQTAVESVRAAGIVVVAAAGNDGADCATIDYPPAIYDASFTVGATDMSDGIGPISSRGPVTIDGSNRLKPDLTAPGIAVTSAVGIWDFAGTGDVYWDYYTADGTSAAAPHVAGAVALLLQARPDLIGEVDAIENLLRATALPLTSTQPCGGLGPADSPNHVFGHGRLDVAELFLGDEDSDGTANVDDCALQDDTAWSLAGDIDDLQLDGHSLTALQWSAPSPGANTAEHDVLRSTTPSDLSGAACVDSGLTGTTSSDATMPGTIFYYLVQTTNPCGTNAGHASGGTVRVTPVCP